MTTWYEDYAAKIAPDQVIGDPNDPYMLRWHITPRDSVRGGVYLHKFLKDDDDRALHDHPWQSHSICLSGELLEFYHFGVGEVDPDNIYSRKVTPGMHIPRSAEMAHRLVVVEPGFTLFMYGPKCREWGFHCNQGWRHWTRFVDPTNTGKHGPGCGEFGDKAVERTIHPDWGDPNDTHTKCPACGEIRFINNECDACGHSPALVGEARSVTT